MKSCIDCGKEISKYAKRCLKCSGTRRKKSKANMGEKNGMWKGDNVGCIPLHNWVRRYKPKPELCEKCGKNKSYDLANISGEYKRDINDFEWICRSCHMENDGRLDNLHKNNRREHKGNLVQCTKCKKFKLKEQFYKNKHNWDGLDLNCKECEKKYSQEPEIITKRREYEKEYYQKQEVKERRKKLAKENYQKNREEILRKQKEYNRKRWLKKK